MNKVNTVFYERKHCILTDLMVQACSKVSKSHEKAAFSVTLRLKCSMIKYDFGSTPFICFVSNDVE